MIIFEVLSLAGPFNLCACGGRRGMGKTVLLERLGEMASERGLAARRIEATGANSFARVLAGELGAIAGDVAARGAALRRVRDAVDQVTLTVGAGPVKAEVRASRPVPVDQALGGLFTALGELARDRKRGVADPPR